MVVDIEEYERSLNLESELMGIAIKVAFDVLSRAGFRVWSFPGTQEEAETMRTSLGEKRFAALQRYISSLEDEEGVEASPDLLAEKDDTLYAVSLVLNDSVLYGSRRRALEKARGFSMVPVVFRTAVEVSIPYSSLELLQEE